MIFRKLLKAIRKSRVINYPIRNFIKSLGRASSLMAARWPVSGIIDCRHENLEFKLYNRSDDNQVNYYYYNLPFHETKVLKLMNAFAKRTKVIMDIGANTGIHSVIISKMNPGTKIYSIEPYQPNYTRLEKNLAINDCHNVEIKKIALGEKEGMITFYVPDDNRITDVTSAVETHGPMIYGNYIKWKKSEVKQSTLDNLFAEIGQIDFFKCDVESYEVNMFKGAMEFLDANRPPFIVEITLNDEKASFFNDLADKFDYTIYFVDEQGLVKLDRIYNFDKQPNFLFTQYNSPHNYIPFTLIEQFADSACPAKSFAHS